MAPKIFVRRKSPAVRWGLGVIAITAAAAVIFYRYSYTRDVEPRMVVNSKNITPGATAQPSAQIAPEVGALPAPAPVDFPAETKGQRVDRLVKSGSPEDAYAAYLIIADCITARKWESKGLVNLLKTLPETTAQRCDGLSPGQLSESRFQWLDKAAEAGVLGAADRVIGDEAPRDANGYLRGLGRTPIDMSDPQNVAFFERLKRYEAIAQAQPAYWGEKSMPASAPSSGMREVRP